MPMQENSTQFFQVKDDGAAEIKVSEKVVNFLKLFARVYSPVSGMTPGLNGMVLN